MISGLEKPPLRAEEILKRVSEYDIYRYYWRNFKIGNSYCSPFRKEESPSFGVFPTRLGKLRHNDYGDSTYHGDCFDFIRQKYSVGYKEALKMIDYDFNLGLWHSTEVKRVAKVSEKYEKQRTLIQIKPKKFSKEDLEYWAQYTLTPDDLVEVYSVSKLFINGLELPVNGLNFAYRFQDGEEEYLKIYSPVGVPRFRTNAPGDLVAGKPLVRQSRTAIITKSYKDQLVLRKIHPDTYSVQSESKTAINMADIKLFQDNFDKVVLIFDPDKAGVEACKHYNQYGFGYCNISKELFSTGVKDMADLAKVRGIEAVRSYLKEKEVI